MPDVFYPRSSPDKMEKNRFKKTSGQGVSFAVRPVSYEVKEQ